MATSFGEGLSDSLSKGIEEADKTRLEYAMQARKMQLDLQQKQAEKEAEYKLQQQYMPGITANTEQAKLAAQQGQNNIPPNEFNVITSMLSKAAESVASGGKIPAMDFSQIKSTQGQQFAREGLKDLFGSRALSGAGLQAVTITNPDGTQTVEFIDKRTGKTVHTTDKGVAPNVVKDLTAGRKAYFAFKNFADRNQKDLMDIVTAKTGLQGIAQAGKLTLNDIAQFNPAAKAFIDQLPYDSASLDKATLGTVRVGGQKMIEKTQDAIFRKNDTLDTVLNKMDRFRKLGVDEVTSRYDAAAQPYPKDIPEIQSMVPNSSYAKLHEIVGGQGTGGGLGGVNSGVTSQSTVAPQGPNPQDPLGVLGQ